MSLCGGQSLPEASLASGFCVEQIPVFVNQTRSIISIGRTDILALERGESSVVLLRDTDDDGTPDTKVPLAVITGDRGLTHGMALNGGFLYASSSTTVYRWPYNPGSDIPDGEDLGVGEVVVANMNADGQGGAPFGHRTRTLIFDDMDRLYVSIGSNDNVDPDSFRSRIRRFELNGENVTLPINFVDGEVFADGLRNTVGLAFDRHGVLWGVENGADRLERDDLGGDIHEDNPAEELNRFREEDAGKHWGYPYCWTEYNLPQPPGMGRGTVWLWPLFLFGGRFSDETCRLEYEAPVLSMQGHSAPLGIAFYEWKDELALPAGCTGAFPREMDGFAFIAFHGSWNREVPTGYKVVYVPMDENGNLTVDAPVDLLKHIPPDAKWSDGFRPVDVDFDDCGRLIVSSDGTRNSNYVGSKVVRISFDSSSLNTQESEIPSQSPSELSTQRPTSTQTMEAASDTSTSSTGALRKELHRGHRLLKYGMLLLVGYAILRM